MSLLRSRLIRLASTNPELRPAILAMLRDAGGLKDVDWKKEVKRLFPEAKQPNDIAAGFQKLCQGLGEVLAADFGANDPDMRVEKWKKDMVSGSVMVSPAVTYGPADNWAPADYDDIEEDMEVPSIIVATDSFTLERRTIEEAIRSDRRLRYFGRKLLEDRKNLKLLADAIGFHMSVALKKTDRWDMQEDFESLHDEVHDRLPRWFTLEGMEITVDKVDRPKVTIAVRSNGIQYLVQVGLQVSATVNAAFDDRAYEDDHAPDPDEAYDSRWA